VLVVVHTNGMTCKKQNTFTCIHIYWPF